MSELKPCMDVESRKWFTVFATVSLLTGCSAELHVESKPTQSATDQIIRGKVASCWDPSEGRNYSVVDVIREDGTVWHHEASVRKDTMPRCQTFTQGELWEFGIAWEPERDGVSGGYVARWVKRLR